MKLKQLNFLAIVSRISLYNVQNREKQFEQYT